MTNKGCLLKIQTSLGTLWGIGAWLLREYHARGYHAFKDKFQIKEFTVNQEISKKSAATTTLNVLHLTNWPHLCGIDV